MTYFPFVTKFGKWSTTFICWHANMQMCAKLCLAVMNRETRNWRRTVQQTSTNSLKNFID
jgi:hypothetical protein